MAQFRGASGRAAVGACMGARRAKPVSEGQNEENEPMRREVLEKVRDSGIKCRGKRTFQKATCPPREGQEFRLRN